MPWKDPIMAAVRQIRDAYAKRFNYDLDAIYRDLKEKERRSGRVVTPCPAKEAAVAGSNEVQAKEST